MAYEIPTLPALIQRTEADFERNAPDALRRADAKVAARALSGTAYELYGYQNWIARQSNPATCDEDMLLRWADWRLEGGRTRPWRPWGRLRSSGSSGALVDAGQLYQLPDGRRYVVLSKRPRWWMAWPALKVMAEAVGSLGNVEAGSLTAVYAGAGRQLDRQHWPRWPAWAALKRKPWRRCAGGCRRRSKTPARSATVPTLWSGLWRCPVSPGPGPCRVGWDRARLAWRSCAMTIRSDPHARPGCRGASLLGPEAPGHLRGVRPGARGATD